MNKIIKRIICLGCAGFLSMNVNIPAVRADDGTFIKKDIEFYSQACTGDLKISHDNAEALNSNNEAEILNRIKKSLGDEKETAEDIPLVGKSLAASTAAESICRYIKNKGKDSEDGRKYYSSFSGSTDIYGSIAYYEAKNILDFVIMPVATDSAAAGDMVMFSYNLSEGRVDHDVCLYMMQEQDSDELFVAGAPFTLNYQEGEQMNAVIVNGTGYSAAYMTKIMTLAVNVGMRIWNSMLLELTGGNYNIGNLGFSDFVSPKNPTGFYDVAPDLYYTDSVKWAVRNKVASGTGSMMFSPNAPCTRAQIVTFLYNAYGNGEISGAPNFSDVSSDKYYYRAVSWAVKAGITSGTGNGKFSPNAPCTRGQAVTFLQKAKQGTSSSSESGEIRFTDVDPNKYYYNAVNWAVENHITSGTTTTTFSPNAICTRAQIVTFLYNAR